MIQMKSDNASEHAMSQAEAPSTSSSKKRPAEQSIKSKCAVNIHKFTMQTKTFPFSIVAETSQGKWTYGSARTAAKKCRGNSK